MFTQVEIHVLQIKVFPQVEIHLLQIQVFNQVEIHFLSTLPTFLLPQLELLSLYHLVIQFWYHLRAPLCLDPLCLVWVSIVRVKAQTSPCLEHAYFSTCRKVIKAFLSRNTTLHEGNVGRLGVRYTFFGDAVLNSSTLKGKGSRPGLHPKHMETLMSVIHNQHPFSLISMTDFRHKIKPKIECAITDYMKPKSKKAV